MKEAGHKKTTYCMGPLKETVKAEGNWWPGSRDGDDNGDQF